ncbi:MAG TPA: hypothetical protein VE262_03165 [Blastocatellia bacterium]|nr:hypothetical protein [Blastocatellia bacterium]
MRRKASIITPRHSSAALLLVCFAVFCASPAGAFASGREQAGPRVRNSTRSFKVVSVEKDENGDYRLSLKNESSKAITAYRIFLPLSKTTIREAFSEARESIAPGAVEVLRIPSHSLAPTGDDPSSKNANVLINAVVFEDRTGDGRAEVLAEMGAERFGKKRQLTRAASRLRKLLEGSDSQLIASLDSLKPENWAALADSEAASILIDFRSENSSFSESPDEAVSRGIMSGLRSGLETAQGLMAGLEQYRSIDDGTPEAVINSKIREAAAKTISACEEIMKKL